MFSQHDSGRPPGRKRSHGIIRQPLQWDLQSPTIKGASHQDVPQCSVPDAEEIISTFLKALMPAAAIDDDALSFQAAIETRPMMLRSQQLADDSQTPADVVLPQNADNADVDQNIGATFPAVATSLGRPGLPAANVHDMCTDDQVPAPDADEDANESLDPAAADEAVLGHGAAQINANPAADAHQLKYLPSMQNSATNAGHTFADMLPSQNVVDPCYEAHRVSIQDSADEANNEIAIETFLTALDHNSESGEALPLVPTMLHVMKPDPENLVDENKEEDINTFVAVNGAYSLPPDSATAADKYPQPNPDDIKARDEPSTSRDRFAHTDADNKDVDIFQSNKDEAKAEESVVAVESDHAANDVPARHTNEKEADLPTLLADVKAAKAAQEKPRAVMNTSPSLYGAAPSWQNATSAPSLACMPSRLASLGAIFSGRNSSAAHDLLRTRNCPVILHTLVQNADNEDSASVADDDQLTAGNSITFLPPINVDSALEDTLTSEHVADACHEAQRAATNPMHADDGQIGFHFELQHTGYSRATFCKYCCGCFHKWRSTSCHAVRISPHQQPPNDNLRALTETTWEIFGQPGQSNITKALEPYLVISREESTLMIHHPTLLLLSTLPLLVADRLIYMLIDSLNFGRRGGVHKKCRPQLHSCRLEFKDHADSRARFKMKPQQQMNTFNNFQIDPG